MKTELYNLEGQKTGTLDVSDAIFARPWNADLVHQVAVAQQANLRRPWAHAKGRGEVRGGGIKPWRQKGTGRARHGSIRSPIWKGGGASHGPVKTRDFSQKINKKMLRGALYCVLSKKLSEGEVKFVDSLKLTDVKTKQVAAAAKALTNVKVTPSVLFVPATANKVFVRASRNLPKSASLVGQALNVNDLLKHKFVVIEQDAVKEIK